jgi:hypothetical protein
MARRHGVKYAPLLATAFSMVPTDLVVRDNIRPGVRGPLAIVFTGETKRCYFDSSSILRHERATFDALITKIFGEHATAMEEAASALSKEERLMLLRLLKKLGKGGEEES